MIRNRFLLVVCSMAIALAVPCVSMAQDSKTKDQKTEGGDTIGGFKLTPNVVVQEEMDEKTLTAKVSYFMGYNLMKNLKQQGQEVDMAQMFEGMKAAAEGPDKKSYISGYQLMANLKTQGADLELQSLFDGMTGATEGKELDMSPEQVQAMMTSFGKLVEKRAVEKMKQKAAENVAAAEAFMAKNAKNPKVKKLDNGVQYEVLVEGTGAKPTREDKVKIHYHGTFLDGKMFDSSTQPRGGGPPKPVELVAGNFVPGFTSCLVEMKVGSKWKVVIPGQLAYGVAGRGQIGPNQALQFEIELLDIVSKDP